MRAASLALPASDLSGPLLPDTFQGARDFVWLVLQRVEAQQLIKIWQALCVAHGKDPAKVVTAQGAGIIGSNPLIVTAVAADLPNKCLKRRRVCVGRACPELGFRGSLILARDSISSTMTHSRPPKSGPFRRWPRRQAVAAVELAVCLPLMVIFTFSSIEMCSAIYLRQTLTIAAYEGARVACHPQGMTAMRTLQAERILTERRINGGSIATNPSISMAWPKAR